MVRKFLMNGPALLFVRDLLLLYMKQSKVAGTHGRIVLGMPQRRSARLGSKPTRGLSRLVPCSIVQVDLLLGTWAEKNVPGLSLAEMDSYEDILNLETVDIFNFVTGNAEPPAFVDTPMMARLQVKP